MCNIVTGVVVQGQNQLQCAIAKDEVARFDGNGRKEQLQTRIGKEHAKAEQQPENSP